MLYEVPGEKQPQSMKTHHRQHNLSSLKDHFQMAVKLVQSSRFATADKKSEEMIRAPAVVAKNIRTAVPALRVHQPAD
jgi:hypothetical protein